MAGLSASRNTTATASSTDSTPDKASSHSPLMALRRRIAAAISQMPRISAQTAISMTVVKAKAKVEISGNSTNRTPMPMPNKPESSSAPHRSRLSRAPRTPLATEKIPSTNENAANTIVKPSSAAPGARNASRSEEHTSELQSREDL